MNSSDSRSVSACSYEKWFVLYCFFTAIHVKVLYEIHQRTTKCIANLADVRDVKECGDAWPAFPFMSILLHIKECGDALPAFLFMSILLHSFVMYCVAAERNAVLKTRKS